MIGFPSRIVRTLGFASKAGADELPCGPDEADAISLHSRLSRLLLRYQGGPPLSVTSHVISGRITLALGALAAERG